jgi:hypothetical protein
MNRIPSRPCSQLTAAGEPCRAWAIRGSDPPLCSAHAGRNIGAGTPPGELAAILDQALEELTAEGHVELSGRAAFTGDPYR